MNGEKCEPSGHVFREGEQMCICRNAMRPKPPDKTPEEVMAWLGGLLCKVCGGQGGGQVAVTAPDGEQLGEEPEGCAACHATGRMLWRLVRGCGCPIEMRLISLEMLIDTGLDLGFATVFTPDEWDEHLPAAWITVRSGHKIEDLLRALVALVERRQLHGLEATT